MKTKEALMRGKQVLNALDAEVLFMHAAKLSRIEMLNQREEELNPGVWERYAAFLETRKNNKPVAYITKQVEFMSLDFYVDERVLIPRPDTEILVEEVLNYNKPKDVLEWCTGSGCIAVSLAVYAPFFNITAIDISPHALAVAEINAQRHNAEITFLEKDVFGDWSGLFTYDIIIANPPYIPAAHLQTLDKSVKDYEPTLALNGGEDGLNFYRCIAKKSRCFLKPGGMLLFEIGYDQSEDVCRLLFEYQFKNIEVKKDLAGHPRVVKGER